MSALKDGNLYVNGLPATIGQAVKTFRGETMTLDGWSAARRRVYLLPGPPNAQAGQRNAAVREYFPSVINAEFR